MSAVAEPMPDLVIHRSAILSPCELFRYRLERDLGTPGKVAAVIGVNPAKADARIDDHSVRKLFGFSSRLGIGRFLLGNKFAFRATDVHELRTAADPVGPDNDRHLEQILRDAELHIVAWGRLAKLPPALRSRWREVVAIADRIGCPLYCFGTAQDGHPLHPLTLGYDRTLVEWKRPDGQGAAA